MKAWFSAQWVKLKAWGVAAWKKVWPFLAAFGAGAVAVLLLVAKGSKRVPSGKAEPPDAVSPSDSPKTQEAAKAAKEEARESTLNRPPADVVHDLDDRARAGIDAAKQAGRDAAREALHGSGGPGGG
jgi:hypothetical protein